MQTVLFFRGGDQRLYSFSVRQNLSDIVTPLYKLFKPKGQGIQFYREIRVQSGTTWVPRDSWSLYNIYSEQYINVLNHSPRYLGFQKTPDYPFYFYTV